MKQSNKQTKSKKTKLRVFHQSLSKEKYLQRSEF